MASDFPPLPGIASAAPNLAGNGEPISANDETKMAADSNPGLARSRLIDHFKRAYQIIVGLAIARACVKVLPHGFSGFPDLEFWLFATLFVTLVPSFHGGDRSLDIKYLGRNFLFP